MVDKYWGVLVRPVVLLLNEVVSGPECNEMCIVRRRWDGHAACTPDICVAQLVRQHLKVVGSKMIVIPQHVIVRWPTGTLHIHRHRILLATATGWSEST